LTEVEPSAASGHWRFLRDLKFSPGSTRFYGPSGPHQDYEKKPCPRRASFLNDLFTDGGDFFWKRPCRWVIVHAINSTEATRRRVSNITVSTARKMCACNTAQPLSLWPRSSWQGGSPTPVASPGQGFQPVDPTVAISSPGPTTKGAFVPALDPQTKGDFALPLDTHRPGFHSHGPRQRVCPLGTRLPLLRGDTTSGRKPSVNST